jgi:palmitoyltransferase
MAAYYVGYIILSLLYLSFVVPKLSLFLNNPGFHDFFVLVILPSPWIIVLLLQFVDPGTVTIHNVDEYLKIYPYDHVIYRPAKCSRLLIPAVPRSQFCPFTQQRVAKFDHYSPWVVACIGQGTIWLYFLLLVANLLIMCYIYVVSCQFLAWNFDGIVARHGEKVSLIYDICVMISKERTVTGLALFCLICGLALSIAVIRQFYLISVNVTTVEIEKNGKEIIRRKKEKDSEPFVPLYDKGFARNWLEVIFPPVVAP